MTRDFSRRSEVRRREEGGKEARRVQLAKGWRPGEEGSYSKMERVRGNDMVWKKKRIVKTRGKCGQRQMVQGEG